MSTTHDHKISPEEVSPEILKQLYQVLHNQHSAVLIGSEDNRIVLPQALNDLVLFVVDAMNRKQAVFMMPEDEAFTTQAAATFLGMSRPYLVRLLEAGTIPFNRVGTHRRIWFSDLLDYQQKRSKERKTILDEMTSKLDEAGVYDRF